MSAETDSELEALRRRVAVLEQELSEARAAAACGAAPGGFGIHVRSGLTDLDRDALLEEAERAAQMGTWIWELSTNAVIWSKQLFRILGYDPARDVATVDAFFAAVHPDDIERVRSLAQRLLEGGEFSKAVSFRVCQRSGTIRECLASATSICEEAGASTRLVGVVLDLTERWRAERERRRGQRMLREAQRIAHVGSWAYDLATRTVDWSEELYRIVGVDPSTQPTFELLFSLIHPEDRPRVFGGAENASPLGAVSPVECRVVRPCDGELRHVRIASELLTDESGAPIGFVGTSLDITERRRLEEQLLHSQKLEAVGRIAGGVAHDFNNMLTAIFGNTELAVRKVAPSSPVHEHLTQIRGAADRAATLTRQLLAFARKQIIQPTILDPNALVLGVEPLLRPLVGEEVELDMRPAGDVWPIRIDRGQFEQLLINLAVNARDAMPDGGRLTIETANMTVLADDIDGPSNMSPGDYVQLVVTDTGHGMDPAIQRHVFEPFFTTKEVGKGSGLGLATCHGIVKQHGGHIWFESASGRGTCFRICFPRVYDAPSEAPTRMPLDVVAGDETVLVAEDDPHVRELCTGALRGFGYSVLSARTGKEALAVAATYPGVIHLLVSDVVLPDLRGPELVLAMRRARPTMRVLFASGYTEDAFGSGYAEDAFGRYGSIAAGAAYLSKPYTPTQLAQAMRQVLDAEGQSRRTPDVAAPPSAAEPQP